MTVQIESVPLYKSESRVTEFLDGVKALEAGQSFLWHSIGANERAMLRAISHVMERKFTAHHTTQGWRVGRVW